MTDAAPVVKTTTIIVETVVETVVASEELEPSVSADSAGELEPAAQVDKDPGTPAPVDTEANVKATEASESSTPDKPAEPSIKSSSVSAEHMESDPNPVPTPQEASAKSDGNEVSAPLAPLVPLTPFLHPPTPEVTYMLLNTDGHSSVSLNSLQPPVMHPVVHIDSAVPDDDVQASHADDSSPAAHSTEANAEVATTSPQVVNTSTIVESLQNEDSVPIENVESRLTTDVHTSTSPSAESTPEPEPDIEASQTTTGSTVITVSDSQCLNLGSKEVEEKDISDEHLNCPTAKMDCATPNTEETGSHCATPKADDPPKAEDDELAALAVPMKEESTEVETPKFAVITLDTEVATNADAEQEPGGTALASCATSSPATPVGTPYSTESIASTAYVNPPGHVAPEDAAALSLLTPFDSPVASPAYHAISPVPEAVPSAVVSVAPCVNDTMDVDSEVENLVTSSSIKSHKAGLGKRPLRSKSPSPTPKRPRNTPSQEKVETITETSKSGLNGNTVKNGSCSTSHTNGVKGASETAVLSLKDGRAKLLSPSTSKDRENAMERVMIAINDLRSTFDTAADALRRFNDQLGSLGSALEAVSKGSTC